MIIGIIGAMDVEVAELQLDIEKVTKIYVSGICFMTGTIGRTRVVLAKCEMGKVNAAICAQELCNRFDVDYLINLGIAGSLNADLDIGDLVISSDVVYHDFDLSPIGIRKGLVPNLPTEMIANPWLIAVATTSAEKIDGVHSKIGRIASGDQFIADQERKLQIVEDFAPDCVEMEGAAIAHVCTVNRVPFVIIRSISDKANGSASQDFNEFQKKASSVCSRVVYNMIRAMENR